MEEENIRPMGPDQGMRSTMQETIHVTREIEITLRAIGGKWTPPILHLLQPRGKQRYMDILRYLEKAPKKALTAQLREPVAGGPLRRAVIPTLPVQAEYDLTERNLLARA